MSALDHAFTFWVVGGPLLTFVAVRSAVSSVVHDEAFTYLTFIKASVTDIVTYVAPGAHANNHIGLSLLSKLSIALFGLNEFALRLPVVAAYGIYLVALRGILKRLVSGPVFWIFFLSAAINPFLIDMMSVARGYGLGTAFMTLAVLLLLKAHDAVGWRALLCSALAMACLWLAVISQFTFLLLYAAGLAWRLGVIVLRVRTNRMSLRAAGFECAVLAALTAALGAVIAGPIAILKATDAFNLAGNTTTSFFYDTVRGVVNGSLYSRPYTGWENTAVSAGVVALVILAIGVVGARLFRADLFDRKFAGLVLTAYLVGGVAMASIIQHYVLNVQYLIERTAVFFIPLISLLGAALVAEFLKTSSKRACAGAAIVAVAFAGLLPVYLSEANLWKRHVWKYDASTRFVMEDLRDMHVSAAPASKTLGGEWLFMPAHNFYIEKYGMSWLKEIEREEPIGRHDYSYLHAGMEVVVAKDNGPLKILRRYGHAGTLLAVPPPESGEGKRSPEEVAEAKNGADARN